MKPRAITFHYTLKDKDGKTVDNSYDGEPMSYIEGASQIIPGLEDGLEGCKTGDKKQIVVTADDGYGDRDERLVMEVPLADLPSGEKVHVGQQFSVELADDSSHPFRVVAVNATHATLDGNHPLAGEDLIFDVEVKEARDATKEELEAAEAELEADGEHDTANIAATAPAATTTDKKVWPYFL